MLQDDATSRLDTLPTAVPSGTANANYPNLNTNSATVRVLMGRSMLASRVFYGVMLILVLIIFTAHLPYAYQRSTISLASDAATLSALGLDPQVLVIFNLLMSIIFVGGFTAVSLLLFIHRAEEPIAFLASVMLLSTGFLYGVTAPRDHPLWLASVAIFAIAETTQILFVFSFPDGRYIPSWVPRLTIPLFIFRFIIWGNIFLTRGSQGAVEVGILVVLLIIGLISIGYRYRKLSTPTQRQQMKWLFIGMVMTVLLVAPSVYLLSITGIVSPYNNLLIYLIVRTGRDLAMLSIPVMIGFSVFRYHLWDIDLTVNRSLVGGLVTLVLLIVFFAGFFALQALTRALFGGDQSGISIAIAGIIVGVLFNPVHARARKLIDRRLYGFRFDLNQLRRAGQPTPGQTPQGLAGSKIGDYELLGLLGRGGMGEVYKAHRGGRTVAVKVLREDVRARHPDTLARFRREASVLKDLRHPRIVSVVDMNTDIDPPYIALEYVDGQTLAAFLRDRGALPLDHFRSLADHLAEVIGYVHQRGIVHRDIKASNIMLRPVDGKPDSLEPVLMDFGIARGETTDLTLTDSEAIGTIDYMAPEQIQSAKDVAHTADIYALGILLYEMLTGQRPFAGRPAQVMFAHLHQPPPDPRKLRPDCPESVAKLVIRALQKNPEDRFLSMSHFRDSLHKAA